MAPRELLVTIEAETLSAPFIHLGGRESLKDERGRGVGGVRQGRSRCSHGAEWTVGPARSGRGAGDSIEVLKGDC